MTKVVLKRPIEHEGKIYAEIEVDEPTVAALIAAEKVRAGGGGDNEAFAAMVAADTGIPLSVLHKQLRQSDFTALAEAMSPLSVEPDGGAAGAA